MYRANLEWRNFNRYFDFLQAEGFITKCNPEPDCYELTEKGKNLLYKLKELCQVLEKDRRNTSIMSRIFAVRQKQVNLFKHQSNSLPILIMSSIMYLMNSKSHIF
jgi:DNA-binding PadR family transcriptional regulator